MPVLTKYASDSRLSVGVLSGLLDAHKSKPRRSLSKCTIADALNEIFPKLSKYAQWMDSKDFAMLHNLLLELEMPEKIKMIMEKTAASDKTWPNRYMSSYNTIPALRSITVAMRENDLPRTTPHYRDFNTNRIEWYLWQSVKPEPSARMERFKAGCGQCALCERLDTFMLSTEKRLQLDLDHTEREHLAGRIRRLPDHSHEYNWKSFIGSWGPGEAFTIVKEVGNYTERHRIWKEEVGKAKIEVQSLGSEGFLRDVLGERYDLIANLGGLRLVRGENGEILGPGVFAQEFQLRTRAPPAVSGSLAQQNVNTVAMNRPPAASPKRRAELDFDQENVPPAAKRNLMIDLCSDDEDI